MKLSVPKGESAVCAGVVPGSKASGKVVYPEVCTEVNHIQRHKYLGEQAHLCEAQRIPKGTYVDVAAIDIRMFMEISNRTFGGVRGAVVVI